MTREEIVPWLHHAGSAAGAIMFLIGAALAFNPEHGWGTRYLLIIGLLWLVIGITIHYNAGGGCIMWSLQGDGD